MAGIFARLAHRMPHTVVFEPYDRASSTEGDPEYDTGAAFTMTPAQMVEGDVKTLGDLGDTATPAGYVIVGPTPEIAVTMRLTLPGDRKVRVLRVDKYPDETGLAVQRVVYG